MSREIDAAASLGEGGSPEADRHLAENFGMTVRQVREFDPQTLDVTRACKFLGLPLKRFDLLAAQPEARGRWVRSAAEQKKDLIETFPDASKDMRETLEAIRKFALRKCLTPDGPALLNGRGPGGDRPGRPRGVPTAALAGAGSLAVVLLGGAAAVFIPWGGGSSGKGAGATASAPVVAPANPAPPGSGAAPQARADTPAPKPSSSPTPLTPAAKPKEMPDDGQLRVAQTMIKILAECNYPVDKYEGLVSERGGAAALPAVIEEFAQKLTTGGVGIILKHRSEFAAALAGSPAARRLWDEHLAGMELRPGKKDTMNAMIEAMARGEPAARGRYRGTNEATLQQVILDYAAALDSGTLKDTRAVDALLEGKPVLQAQLAAARKAGGGPADAPKDPFQPSTVWVEAEPRRVLRVTARTGDSFRAVFTIRDTTEREILGTIKGNKVSWLARDVRAIRGGPGGDNQGVITTDKDGARIELAWRDENGKSGTFTLRLRGDR